MTTTKPTEDGNQTILAEMLRMDEEQIAAFVRAGNAISAVSHLPLVSPYRKRYSKPSHLLAQRVEALIATRRIAPADDLISALIAARDEGDKLSASASTDGPLEKLTRGSRFTRDAAEYLATLE